MSNYPNALWRAELIVDLVDEIEQFISSKLPVGSKNRDIAMELMDHVKCTATRNVGIFWLMVALSYASMDKWTEMALSVRAAKGMKGCDVEPIWEGRIIAPYIKEYGLVLLIPANGNFGQLRSFRENPNQDPWEGVAPPPNPTYIDARIRLAPVPRISWGEFGAELERQMRDVPGIRFDKERDRE